MEKNMQTGMETTHVAGDDQTHEPAEEPGKSGTAKTLDSPLADEDVRTDQQRNQSWTSQSPTDPRRENEGEPLRSDSQPPPTMDMPDDLEAKLDDVMAHPHSDAEDTSETQGGHRELGGLPKTGSGEQDPMRQAGGGQFGG